MASILVVDDQADHRELIRSLLEAAGFSVRTANDGREGLKAFFSAPPDLALLDVRMPGLDGWELLGRIREMSDTPVIMLTALGEESEIVKGLEIGADDYLAKPFGEAEVVARVKAVLRRAGLVSELHEAYRDSVVHVDFERHRVHVRGQETRLTPLEFRLLSAFVRNAGKLLSADRVVDECWGDRPAGPLNVRLLVNYLRNKIEENPGKPELIETVREFGYRYRPPEED